MKCKCYNEVLAALEVRENDRVLAWGSRLENEDALWRALSFVEDLSVWTVYNA